MQGFGCLCCSEAEKLKNGRRDLCYLIQQVTGGGNSLCTSSSCWILLSEVAKMCTEELDVLLELTEASSTLCSFCDTLWFLISWAGLLLKTLDGVAGDPVTALVLLSLGA